VRGREEEPGLPRPGGMSAENSKSSAHGRFADSMSVVVSILLVSRGFSKDILCLRLVKQESRRREKDLLEGGTFFSLLCELIFHLLVTMSELNICVWVMGDSSALSPTSTIGTICNVCQREERAVQRCRWAHTGGPRRPRKVAKEPRSRVHLTERRRVGVLRKFKQEQQR
jgi:hypothetical protein